MSWVLIIALYNSDYLFVKDFPTEDECLSLKLEIVRELKDPDVKSISCEKGNISDYEETDSNHNEEINI